MKNRVISYIMYIRVFVHSYITCIRTYEYS